MTQTVFITGASRGIGRSTAQLFRERGWNVAATRRRPEPAGDWLEGDRALASRLDVTDVESIHSATAQAIAHFGAVDVLVNQRRKSPGHVGEQPAAQEVDDEVGEPEVMDFRVPPHGQSSQLPVARSMFRRRDRSAA
jgi:NAD(P)-dependent dehydrogenase (short-subunit alcohol dehydrogenase family)